MDYLRKTFPNAANPMQIFPSPSLPSLKVQRLNVLNKISTIKGSCIRSDSKDGTEQNNVQPNEQISVQKSDLERRTVDTKHISTVSSLVATKSESDDGNKASKSKESQRNNFGLYALKFHRNLANHANTMLTTLKKDNWMRSKSSKSFKSNESTVCESPKCDKNATHRSKHEYFEPCDRAQSNYHATHGECYDDEFDEGASVDVWNNTNRFQRNRSRNVPEPNVNGSSTRAPVRPKRVKPIAPKANSIAAHDANTTKNMHNAGNHQYLPYECTQSMDDFESDQNVMNI